MSLTFRRKDRHEWQLLDMTMTQLASVWNVFLLSSLGKPFRYFAQTKMDLLLSIFRNLIQWLMNSFEIIKKKQSEK